MKKYIFVLSFLYISVQVLAQSPKPMNAAEILLSLKKLNVLGTVLYIAAHPDDENTRLITYLSKERKVRTGYLSLTRGDGGQNSIGNEIQELLGIVRTQELLSARRIDGGEQFFSRAIDFGYSKTAEESLRIWGRDEVLYDVVWVIRNFRPDVIITRFPADRRAGHGQHEASAILAKEAFSLAADKSAYPEQLKHVETWQSKRLLLNTGRWWNDSIKADYPGVITVNVGEYNALLGKSYSEIAARSRSQHKSQGFGVSAQRGELIEFLEHVKGDETTKDLFEGINLDWSQLGNGKHIGTMVEELIRSFNPEKPADIVPGLLKVRKEIEQINNDYWKKVKLNEVDRLVKACLGLYLEVSAEDNTFTPGDSIELKVEAVNRSNVPVSLKSIDFNVEVDGINKICKLQYNQREDFEHAFVIPEKIPFSNPYWLREEGSLGLYQVEDKTKIGKPQNDPPLLAIFEMDITGETITYEVPIVKKWTSFIQGEQYEPIAITPPVFINLSDNVYLFPDSNPELITVSVISGKDSIDGDVSLKVPEDWQVKPAYHPFQLAGKGDEAEFNFMVIPPEQPGTEFITAKATLNEKKYDQSLVTINYDHIPKQILFPKAKAKVVRLDLVSEGKDIGYIMGAGDEVASSLEQVGYNVTFLHDENLGKVDLSKFEAIVFGVMAFNNLDYLDKYEDNILNYVKEGGTVIVQYNNARFPFSSELIAPYDIEFASSSFHARVSVEEAEVRFLKPDHPVLNNPNRITQEDFKNWIQERGLYFPKDWEESFAAVLSSNDPGEDPKDGGLLVAPYGEGYYVYTGYSWFRELPAGVPGAYRIFANMIALGD